MSSPEGAEAAFLQLVIRFPTSILHSKQDPQISTNYIYETHDLTPPLSLSSNQLNFPGLLFLSLLVPSGVFFLVRYKYLNKYTDLKEVP